MCHYVIEKKEGLPRILGIAHGIASCNGFPAAESGKDNNVTY